MLNMFLSDLMFLLTTYFYRAIKKKITHLILFGSICKASRITKDKLKTTVDEPSVCN